MRMKLGLAADLRNLSFCYLRQRSHFCPSPSRLSCAGEVERALSHQLESVRREVWKAQLRFRLQ